MGCDDYESPGHSEALSHSERCQRLRARIAGLPAKYFTVETLSIAARLFLPSFSEDNLMKHKHDNVRDVETLEEYLKSQRL